MRRILASSLVLSASLLPAAAFAAKPDGSITTHNVRVSTGVIAPTVLSAISVVPPSSMLAQSVPTPAHVGLDVTVDDQGQAKDIRVIQSLTPDWDANVVEAVRQFHFRPAKLDGQPFPMQIHLIVNIQR